MTLATLSDIRLGWIYRFHLVARHRNLTRASRECRVDPTAISDSIQRLEQALCRPLLIPTTARLTALGKAFIRGADEIVRMTAIFPGFSRNVTIGALQSLIAIAQHENYVTAAKALGRTRFAMMREMKIIQDWIGSSPVYRADKIRLSLEGQAALEVAHKIILILEESFGPDTNRDHWKRKRRTKPWWLRTCSVSP